MTNDVHLLILLLTLVLAYGIYWYTRPPNVNNSSSESKSVQDTFMQQIHSVKADSDTTVSAAPRQHERDLEERFAKEIQLKQRLSQFSKDMELDKALIALWEEIESYPEWSSREDFQKWNMLNVPGVSGTKDKDTESGLWVDPKPIPPWEWRHQVRTR